MNNSDITITIRANSALFTAAMKEAVAQTKALNPQLASAAGIVDDLGNSSDSATNKTGRLNGALSTLNKTSAAVFGVIAGVASSLATRAIDGIASSVGSAIRRVDTLNNSTKVFQNLGFSTSDVNAAMTALNKSILGLPTSLDQGVRGMQSLSMQSGNILAARTAFTAFNDAVLSSGHSTDELQNAIEQFTQVGLDGPLDAQTWNSLRQSGLEPAMKAMADMNHMSFSDLKNAFSADGTLTAQDFLTMLEKLDTQGAGHFASLSKQAKDMTGGIATGWANMQTAIARGIGGIIQAVGSANISNTIADIGKSTESSLKAVAGAIGFVKDNKDIFAPIAVGVGTIVAGFTAWAAAIKAAAIAQAVFNAVMSANPIGVIILAVAALVAGIVYFFTQTKTGQAIVKTVFTAIGEFIKSLVAITSDVVSSVSSFFKGLWNSITTIFGNIGSFFTSIWNGVIAAFNSVVSFLKDWGPSILAVIFWPFALAIGLIIQNWSTITAFFQVIRDGIVAIFTPIASFFVGLFNLALAGIKLIWDGVVWYYSTIWNGIVAIFTVTGSFFISVFKAAWLGIVEIWNVAIGFFNSVWSGIVAIFSPVVSWFINVFRGAWNGIVSIFSGAYGFFRGIWNGIVGIFGSIGITIGNGIAGSVKGVVNSILSGAEGIINGFISAINGAIGTINRIPGVHIGGLGLLHLPRLATGGIVSATPGGANITVAEGGQDEWVVPQSKMASIVSQVMAQATQSGDASTSRNPVLQIMGSLIGQIVIEGGKEFTDSDAIDIAKKIARALKAQGLDIDEMGALRG